MNGLRYTIILEEPVLANSLSGDTNSARSLPFIPGGLVRGALINAYLNGKSEDAAESNFNRLFLSGETRYLHAYPEINKVRSLPAPLSWKRYKDDPDSKIFNFARLIIKDEKITGKSFDLYSLNGNMVYALKQEWQVNVHTQRDAVLGRAADSGRGAVYRYEALPAGWRLKGVILTSSQQDTDTLKNLLEKGSILLGKARAAGYGRAKFVVEELKDNWREGFEGALPSGTVSEFTLTFLSDTLLRDENGQFTLDPIPALNQKLNTTLTVKSIFRKAEIVGGFNRFWGAPLPQGQAIGAGSVFVFSAKPEIEPEVLKKLELSGLGERTAEGFGRLAFEVDQKDSYDFEDLKFSVNKTELTDLSDAEKAIADLMMKRLMRRELDQMLMSAALTAIRVYQPKTVPNSQLSRWRVNLRNAIGMKDSVERVKKIRDLYRKESDRNSSAWQKMVRARVMIGDKSVRITEWLDALLTNPSGVWGMLDKKARKPAYSIGKIPLMIDEKIESEYSLRFIDAVFASVAKKNAQDKDGGKNG
jgi:CRISPR-associated protein Csx10